MAETDPKSVQDLTNVVSRDVRRASASCVAFAGVANMVAYEARTQSLTLEWKIWGFFTNAGV